MEVPFETRILAAEKLGNRVLIAFDDGQCAVFSASLLHATIPQAEQVIEEEEFDA